MYSKVLGELESVLAGIVEAEVEAACEAIARAGRIMTYGCGREGLQMRGLAMRLYHLGLDVAHQGDMTAPPLGPGDLFLASAGPGSLSTVTALLGVAREAGAEVVLLTAEPGAEPVRLASSVLVIPAQTMARDQGAPQSLLPMGSLYEGALFVLFETMILRLRDRLGVTPEAMRARHTNME